MIDYKSKILSILEKSNGLFIDDIETRLRSTLSDGEKKDYDVRGFERLFKTVWRMEEEGLIIKGEGKKLERGKYYLVKKPDEPYKNLNE